MSFTGFSLSSTLPSVLPNAHWMCIVVSALAGAVTGIYILYLTTCHKNIVSFAGKFININSPCSSNISHRTITDSTVGARYCNMPWPRILFCVVLLLLDNKPERKFIARTRGSGIHSFAYCFNYCFIKIFNHRHVSPIYEGVRLQVRCCPQWIVDRQYQVCHIGVRLDTWYLRIGF